MRITAWIVFGVLALVGIGLNLLRLKLTIGGYRHPSKKPPQNEGDKP
jgi:hypothetical protein